MLSFEIVERLRRAGFQHTAQRFLTPKEWRILEMRHGLTDGVMRTLEEVGQEFGVTRERIRQIEAKMEEKVRLLSESQLYEVLDRRPRPN